MLGLVGKKCGMTRIFTPEGQSIPVTVVEVLPNTITQVKKTETDGYEAIQVTTGLRRRSRVNKPMAGHYAKANVEPGIGLWEFLLSAEEAKSEQIKVAGELTVNLFEAGQYVDVRGESKGKGFQGTIKRYNFAGQDRTHGNSLSHRAPGSIGQNQSPGRVFKGKKMFGHMGAENVSIQCLEIVKIDETRNLLLIKGAIPGSVNGIVMIRPSLKKMKDK